MFETLWSSFFAPATVDWCEPNYVHVSWVAETWNTLSSLFMTAIGAFGAARSVRDGHETRFALAYLGLALVGVGSAAFHGTILRGPQAADELPMIYVGLVSAWIMLHRDRPRGASVTGLTIAFSGVAVIFSAVYAAASSAFVLFSLLWGGLVVWIAAKSMLVSVARGEGDPLLRRYVAAVLAMLAGVLLFWIPEHLILGCDHPLQGLQLHSWWHLCSGISVFTWMRWAELDRLDVLALAAEQEASSRAVAK